MKFPRVKISLILLFCVMIFLQIGVFAAQTTAADCTTCNAPAKQFTWMLDMARELTNAMKTQGTAGDYIGKPVSPNRFEGTTFNPPKQNILDKVATNISQKLNYVAATTAIFTSPQQGGGLEDLLGGIIILFRNQIFARDFQSVQTMNTLLTQKKYELGMGGGRYETVSPSNLKVFQDILQSYQVKGLLTQGYSLSSTIKYSQVTALIERLLSAMKSFVSVNDVSGFDPQMLGSNAFRITIDNAAIQAMQQQYICARGVKNICDSKYKDFAKNMKKLGSDTILSVKKVGKTFGDASKRLVATFNFSAQSSEFKAREQQLLKSYYGNTKIRSGGSLLSAKMDAGGFLSTWRSVAVDTSNRVVSTIDLFKTSAPTGTSSTPISTSTQEPTLVSQIKANMLPFVEDQKRDLTLVNFADIKDFSSYFHGLSLQIAEVRKLLGNKDTNGTLIKSLGDACLLQCGGIKKTCRK